MVSMSLGDFNATVGREDMTIGDESLHKISNDNGVILVSFTATKNFSVKSTMFPHRNILKYYLDVSRWENPQSDLLYFDR
jgi:hypothetical protein